MITRRVRGHALAAEVPCEFLLRRQHRFEAKVCTLLPGQEPLQCKARVCSETD